jgi:CxxC motif-containing protein
MNELTTKTITCTVCPIGCQIEVRLNESGQVKDISGNSCKRGYTYAVTEFTNPTRTLTSTVKCESKTDRLIPVKTSSPIPKAKLFDAMKLINDLECKAPIKIGDVIYKDFIEKGVDLVATKNVEE